MRKDWREGESEFIETGLDGIGHVRIKKAEGNLNIVVVYNKENGKGKKIGKTIKKITEKCEGERIIVNGNFNIRTGELGGNEEEGETTRKSRDKTIGNGGRKLIDLMQEVRLEILNGKTEGD